MGKGTLICLSGEQDGLGRSEDLIGREKKTREHDDGNQEGRVMERPENAKEGRPRWKTSGEKGQFC